MTTLPDADKAYGPINHNKNKTTAIPENRDNNKGREGTPKPLFSNSNQTVFG